MSTRWMRDRLESAGYAVAALLFVAAVVWYFWTLISGGIEHKKVEAWERACLLQCGRDGYDEARLNKETAACECLRVGPAERSEP